MRGDAGDGLWCDTCPTGWGVLWAPDMLSPLCCCWGTQLLAPPRERPVRGALGRGCRVLMGATVLALPEWHFEGICHPLTMPGLEGGRNKAKGLFPRHL